MSYVMKLKAEQIDRTRTRTFEDKKTHQPKTVRKFGVLCGGRWYGAFEAEWNKTIKEGDTFEVEVTENTKNGKTFYNIKPVSEEKKFADEINKSLIQITKKLMEIDDKLSKLLTAAPKKATESVSVGFGNDQESAPRDEDESEECAVDSFPPSDTPF